MLSVLVSTALTHFGMTDAEDLQEMMKRVRSAVAQASNPEGNKAGAAVLDKNKDKAR